MSKAVKKVLTVAAAVAVAYFAPQVAGALLKSASGAAAASTAAKVVATAAVNAAGNAAIAAATGGDIGKAAITGAITGGISGYMTAPTAAATAPGAAAPAAGATTTAATGAAPTAGLQGLQEVVVTGTRVPVGASGLPIVSALGGGTAGTTLQEVTPTGTRIPGAMSPADLEAGRLANQLNSPNLGTRALATLRTAGQDVVTKFTDPRAIADMTLRAAGQLAGSALAGSGLSPAEEQLLAAQAADLQELKNTNQELYNLRLEQAKAMLGEAARDYGFEEESRARVRGAGLTTAAVRGLTGERRRAELARQRRARAEETATGRARGELMTAQNTAAARQAGLSALPGAGPQAATMAARAGLMGDYAEAERRRREASEQAGQLFGKFTGQRQAGLTDSDIQDEVDRRIGREQRMRFGSITG